MITRFAHAGVEHATEIEASAHNKAPLLFLISGVALATGIVIYWLLARTSSAIVDEENQE